MTGILNVMRLSRCMCGNIGFGGIREAGRVAYDDHRGN